MSGKAGNNAGASYVHFSTGHEDLVHDVAYGTSLRPPEELQFLTQL